MRVETFGNWLQQRTSLIAEWYRAIIIDWAVMGIFCVLPAIGVWQNAIYMKILSGGNERNASSGNNSQLQNFMDHILQYYGGNLLNLKHTESGVAEHSNQPVSNCSLFI